MPSHNYYIYILSNKNNTLLYTGVTNNLARRCYEHKNKPVEGFTKKYNVDKLLYFESFNRIEAATARETQIKRFMRKKKELLIASMNPDWLDLYDEGQIKMPGFEQRDFSLRSE